MSKPSAFQVPQGLKAGHNILPLAKETILEDEKADERIVTPGNNKIGKASKGIERQEAKHSYNNAQQCM